MFGDLNCAAISFPLPTAELVWSCSGVASRSKLISMFLCPVSVQSVFESVFFLVKLTKTYQSNKNGLIDCGLNLETLTYLNLLRDNYTLPFCAITLLPIKRSSSKRIIL